MKVQFDNPETNIRLTQWGGNCLQEKATIVPSRVLVKTI